MIQITELSKSYGTQKLLDGVSFSLSKGEKVGVIGRNGHGKTTLFRLILGQEEIDSGNIFIPQDYRIGYVSQRLNFLKESVLKEALLGILKVEDRSLYSYKAEAVLRGLGFSEEMLSLNPEKLSGGYQVRLNLAKLLLSEPDLLLLDEPTNYLDIVTMRFVKRFLREWRGEFLIITHDRDFMDSVTTHTLAIHRRKIKKIKGDSRKLVSQISQEEQIHEKTRVNQEKYIKETENFVRRFRAKASKAKAVQSRVKSLEKIQRVKRLDDVDDLNFRFTEAPFEGKWLLRVENLGFKYKDSRDELFSNLSFSIRYGDRIGVIGKNGRGKTTLLRVLSNELSPVSGESVFSKNVKLSHFGQTNVDRLNPSLTIEEEILNSLEEKSRGRARSISGMMMFEGDMGLKKISVLSGGERSRVLLAKVLACPSNMLLLDEPTNHLDLESSGALIEAIKNFSGGVLVVSHSEELIREVSNRLIVFDGKGAFLFEGNYDAFLERIGWEDESEIRKQKDNKAEKKGNKKEERKKRALRLKERNRVIKPLEEEVERLEREIISLEESIEVKTKDLIEMTKDGYGDAAAKASRLLHRDKERVEELFELFENASNKLKNALEEFEA